MWGALMSEQIKIRKTWIKILVVLGPVGIIFLNVARYVQSYHTIVKPGNNEFNWALLIQNVSHLMMPSLMLGITLLATLLSGLEHQGHAWKQLFALPVTRFQLYVSKFMWLAGLLAISTILCAIGTLSIGIAFGFTSHIPWENILGGCFYPYFAAFGIMAFQLMISILFSNQTFAITIGVFGVIISGFSDALSPEGIAHAGSWAPFIPWVYPSLSAITHATVQHLNFHYVVFGIGVGILLIVMGNSAFARKEV